MRPIITQSFQQAVKICEPLSKVVLPKQIEELLDSGKVLFYFNQVESDSTCWPYFPIGNHRQIVKDLKKQGFQIPKEVKVVVEIGMNEKIEEYILDCLGHVTLYLLSPRASNECEDAEKIIEEMGITLSL